MQPNEELITHVVKAAGNEIVGRIRLQKVLYLLDQKGMGVQNPSFHYYHYGPYSRVLDDALERAKALSGMREIIRYRMADGAPFSVFQTTADTAMPDQIGNLPSAEAQRLIALMKSKTSTVIELAATIHWLIQHEKVSDWKTEIVKRKAQKTEGGRLGEALTLLSELDIEVPS
jgi:uncharacterized protein YwgA